jgi:hypothetical protein
MANPNESRIRDRAFELWDAAGRPADRDLDHWLQAEREAAPDAGPDAVEGPDEAATREPGPDETVETISEDPKSSIVTLTQSAPDSVESDG